MKNKYQEMLAQKQVKAQEELIRLAMPCEATPSRIVATQHGSSGKTVYSFDNKPFLEVFLPSFETLLEDGSYKIKATQNYRIIKEQTHDK